MGGKFQIEAGRDTITVEQVQGKAKILTVYRPAGLKTPAEEIKVRLDPDTTDDVIYALNWGRSRPLGKGF